MRNLFAVFVLVITLSGMAFAQVKPIGELRRLFDYDPTMPLDVKEIGVEERNGVFILDISYVVQKAAEYRLIWSCLLARANLQASSSCT